MRGQSIKLSRGIGDLVRSFVLFALAGGYGGISLLSTSNAYAQDEESINSKVSPGEVVTVELSNLPATVSLAGTVVPRHLITLSSKMPGRVTYLAGPVGTRFFPNQPLLGLDKDSLEAQRRIAWANLADASAVLQDANVQLYRRIYAPDPSPQGGFGVMQLFDQYVTRPASNIVGNSNTRAEKFAEYNQSRVAVERAQAGVMRAQSRIDEIEIRIDDTLILGPGHGVILEKFVERGNIVQPGQPLMRVADTDDLLIRLEVPARVVSSLYRGMPVEVKINALGISLNTIVERVFPAADPFRHTVTVELAVPIGARVAVGMYATVALPDANQQTAALPTIPVSSLVWRGSQPGVFVVDSNQNAELRLLRVGQETQDGVVVLSGLNSGDRILASPPADFRAASDSSTNDG